jgi:hypothetical protein
MISRFGPGERVALERPSGMRRGNGEGSFDIAASGRVVVGSVAHNILG